MNFILFLVFLLVVFFLGYIPGRILVQPLPLDEKVKFALSFGVSYFLYFLAGFSSYIFHISYIYAAVLLLILVSTAGIFIYKKKQLIISRNEINLVIIFFLAYLFVISTQSLIPYYSGAASFWDWYEHYLRSMIFYSHLPPSTVMGGHIFLYQRQPLFNAAASFLMSLLSQDFWVYQTIAVLFSISVLLPCFLILVNFISSKKQITLFIFLTILFLLNPYINAMLITYTATKLLATYYLLMGLYFIFREHKGGQILPIYLAMIFFALSHLVHFEGLPYIFISVIILFISSLCSKHFRYFLSSLPIYIGIVSIWYIWSFITYGAELTFFHNRNLELLKNISYFQRIELITHNLIYTTIPFISKESMERTYNSVNYLVMIYDRIIALYSTNIPWALSVTICFSAILLALIKLRKAIADKSFKVRPGFRHFIIILFVLAGYITALFTTHLLAAGGASWMVVPSIFLLFSLGAIPIIFLAKKFGRKFIYLITFIVMLESLIGIGYRLYAAKYQLDPQINTNIDINRELFAVTGEDKYAHFAVHLLNYQLKTDNHLIFLYDKFYDLHNLFYVLVIGSWFVLAWIFILCLTRLSTSGGER